MSMSNVPPSNGGADIAIVGGGFAAMAVLQAIIEQKLPPLHIIVFAPRGLASSMAYDTPCLAHLLNVPTGRLGLSANAPEDFLAWCRGRYNHELESYSFVPRAWYGEYLRLYAEAVQAQAQQQGHKLEVLRGAVSAIAPTSTPANPATYAISSDAGQFLAQHIVLATGPKPAAPLPSSANLAASGAEHYLPDLWQADNYPILQSIAKLGARQAGKAPSVAIIGSGLTALDAVLWLEELGFTGEYLLCSRHALLPLPHAPSAGGVATLVAPPDISRLSIGLQQMRQAVQTRAGAYAYVDSLRAQTPQLWAELGISGQRQFLRHLLPYWNRLRHRAAPAAWQVLPRLQLQGRLRLVPQRVASISAKAKQLTLHLPSQSAPEHKIMVAGAISCRGWNLSGDVAYLQPLIKAGLLQQHALGGLVPRGSGGAEPVTGQHTQVAPNIYALGCLLWGAYFESTAIPEIRAQAQQTAENIARTQAKQLDSANYC